MTTEEMKKIEKTEAELAYERRNVTFEQWLEIDGDNWPDEEYDHDKMVERWGDFLNGGDYQI